MADSKQPQMNGIPKITQQHQHHQGPQINMTGQQSAPVVAASGLLKFSSSSSSLSSLSMNPHTLNIISSASSSQLATNMNGANGKLIPPEFDQIHNPSSMLSASLTLSTLSSPQQQASMLSSPAVSSASSVSSIASTAYRHENSPMINKPIMVTPAPAIISTEALSNRFNKNLNGLLDIVNSIKTDSSQILLPPQQITKYTNVLENSS